MATKKVKLYVASTSFILPGNDSRVKRVVTAGQVIKADDEDIKDLLKYELVDPVDDEVVEEATAKPGVKRRTKPKVSDEPVEE